MFNFFKKKVIRFQVFPPYYDHADLDMALNNFMQDHPEFDFGRLEVTTNEVLVPVEDRAEKKIAYHAILTYWAPDYETL